MFETKTIQATMKELESPARDGLSEQEAKRRLTDAGHNVLKEARKKTMPELFLEQLNDPLIFILFVATAISILLGETSDAAIIVTVIAVNAIVGVVQEGKARKALDALKKLTSPKTLVRRDGMLKEIQAADLVPGDIVCLDAGRQVPADLRLIETVNLKIEESALTGESLPVQKDADFVSLSELPVGDRKNMAYMSTGVTYGRGEGIVTATGMQTEIGRIADLINKVPAETTPLQKRLADLGKMLSIVSVLLCVLLFGVAVLQKRDVGEMLLTAISLAVAAVPEGLPAVVTIVLALSVSRMVKVNTIVRRLPSVETLGAVSVVCSDKTGTLTQNKMKVRKCSIGLQLYEPEQLTAATAAPLWEGMVLCNDASIQKNKRIGDPTELALLELGRLKGFTREGLADDMPRVGEKPFESDRKMMTTLHRRQGRMVSYTKGAPDEVLKRCNAIWSYGRVLPLTEEAGLRIRRMIQEMSAEALRVLAVAMRQDAVGPEEDKLTFIGLVGMMDPARPEAAQAVSKFRNAGVDTVMITGDHVDTAYAIARELGIASDRKECMTGEQINRLSEEELAQRVEKLHVFARVSPEHKVRIVKAFRKNNRIVAMTGDGVNDAPSLKAADIGIAMGMTGTDVAKNSADIILTDDNFATIEKAIEEGRGIYENIRKSVLFLLSSNFGEIITMLLAVICGLSAPLKASHILWINLITDSLPALALGVDRNDGNQLMRHKPRKANESLFAKGGLSVTICYGAVIGAISLAAFLKIPYQMLLEYEMDINFSNMAAILQLPDILSRAQTHAFTVLGMSQLFHAAGMRNLEKSIFKSKPFSNKLMLFAFVAGFGLQFMVTEIPYFISVFGTVPLSLKEWGQLICLSLTPLLVHEFMLLTYFPVSFSEKCGKLSRESES